MYISRYCKVFPWAAQPEYLLLYSTKRAATILIEEATFASMKDGSLDVSEQATLSELGFLVESPEQEQQELLTSIERMNAASQVFTAQVVMNLDCNLGCIYCYEQKFKSKQYLSEDTTKLLISYLTEQSFNRGKDLVLNFYGGEPLLSFDRIKEISTTLQRLAESQQRSYSFHLVTNGTLLSGEKTQELSPLGLKSVTVNLDGPKESHDHYRPFLSGYGSFTTIIEKMLEASAFTKILVGGNFTRENYRIFPQLLDYLLELGLTPEKIILVKFDPVASSKTQPQLIEFTGGCISINEPWLFEAGIFLREEILKRGFFTPKLGPSSCLIESLNHLIVHVDGTLYKCPGFIGLPEFSVGHLSSGVKDYGPSHHLGLWKNETCLACVYLPLCFGGCRYMNLLNYGRLETIECRKPYLDATLEAFIHQELGLVPSVLDEE